MTDWFGKRHDAPVYDEGAEVPVPVGMACWYCGARIKADDDGFQLPAITEVGEITPANYHRNCLLFLVLGPIADDLS